MKPMKPMVSTACWDSSKPPVRTQCPKKKASNTQGIQEDYAVNNVRYQDCFPNRSRDPTDLSLRKVVGDPEGRLNGDRRLQAVRYEDPFPLEQTVGR